MYRGTEYEKRDAVAVVIVGILAVITFGAWRMTAADAVKQQQVNTRQVKLNQAAVGELMQYDEASVESARTRVNAWKERLLAREDWQKRITDAAGDWVYQPGSSRQLNGFLERRGTFRLLSSSIADWPKVVKAVEELEAHPSIAISRVEMRTTGDKARRSFDLVRFDVVYLSKD